MGFSATNPVAVGQYILASDYDVVWDNTQFLHDNILQVTGVGGVVIGETARVNIKQIGRTARNESIDILAGTTATASDMDGQLTIVGKTHAGLYSGFFVARTSTDKSWKFFDDDRATVWCAIDYETNIGLIRRDADTGCVEIRGGPDGNDARIQARGQNMAGGLSGIFRARADNSPFYFLKNDDSNVVGINASTGVTTFYNSGTPDATDYVAITADAAPQIEIYANGGQTMLLDGVSLTFSGSGTHFIHQNEAAASFDIRSDGTLYLTSDYDGGAYIWGFGQTGLMTLPDASASGGANGDFYYEATGGTNGTGGLYVRLNATNILIASGPA